MANRHIKMDWFGDELTAAVTKAQEPGLFALGEVVLAEARRRAPSKSGELRRSGFVATTSRSTYKRQARDRKARLRVREGEVLISFASYYGRFFEGRGVAAHVLPAKGAVNIPGYGWRSRVNHPGIRRRPFLAPALEAVQGRAVEALADVLGAAIERDLPRSG